MPIGRRVGGGWFRVVISLIWVNIEFVGGLLKWQKRQGFTLG